MNVKKATLIVLIAGIVTLISNSTHAANTAALSNKKTRNAFYIGSAIALVGSGFFQRIQSLIPAKRYPLMQQRGILNALIKKEESGEKASTSRAELLRINKELQALEEENKINNIAKYSLLAACMGSAFCGYYNS
jgi:hypothetical protein